MIALNNISFFVLVEYVTLSFINFNQLSFN
jgi:hypothetical protein